MLVLGVCIFFFFKFFFFFFFFKQKTAYEIVSRDWSSDVCSSDLNSVSDMFIINIDFVLSVENEIPDFLFYPNPVTSDFRINAGDVEGTIRILSFEGKVLRQYQYSPTEIGRASCRERV